MKILGNAVKVGMTLDLDGNLWKVTKTQHTQPGKGGAYLQAELKNIIDGSKTTMRFRSSESVNRAVLEQTTFQYLYSATSDTHTFMNMDTYEQIDLSDDLLGEDQVAYLHEGMEVTIETYQEKIIGVQIPDQVTLTVTDTEAVLKGQTVTSGYKPATLENGVKTTVPPHVSVGTKIVVNTSDNSYVSKAKD